MGFWFFRGATRKRRDSKELKDEIDPCEGKVQTLMGPQSGVTDGSRSEPAGAPAQWTLRESIEQG